MGTNFYARIDSCTHCGRSSDSLHIGKSSAGWCFSLHVIEYAGLDSLDDWREYLQRPNIRIFDEYDKEISYEEMIDRITVRGRGSWDELRAEHGTDVINHSIASSGGFEGPAGLLRHPVDGIHCVGHGAGTWDYIRGNFS